MQWDWGTANQILDDVIIVAGTIILIVRQFIWRSTQLHRMLRLPVVIIGAGFVYLASEVWGGFHWVTADWIIIGELSLVTVTGTIMGLVTRFRITRGHLQYKLSPAGIWLWALFIVIRVGSFFLASVLGANLAETTGLILLSFGANRLAAILVVRKRAGQSSKSSNPSRMSPRDSTPLSAASSSST